MTSQHLFQNIFFLRKPKVAIFADIIKIVNMFIKKIFTDSKKLKELEFLHENAIFIFVSWYSKICWFPLKKLQTSGELNGCDVMHKVFEPSLGKVCLCQASSL